LGPAASSNSLVLFGRRLLLKVFRRLEPGINPDVEIGRFLTEQGCFQRGPKLAGTLEYRPDGADGGSAGSGGSEPRSGADIRQVPRTPVSSGQ